MHGEILLAARTGLFLTMNSYLYETCPG